jgi:hypothetical protein
MPLTWNPVTRRFFLARRSLFCQIKIRLKRNDRDSKLERKVKLCVDRAGIAVYPWGLLGESREEGWL